MSVAVGVRTVGNVIAGEEQPVDEDHGPRAKESDLDQWARWIAWFDIYVKNKQAPVQAGAVVPH